MENKEIDFGFLRARRLYPSKMPFPEKMKIAHYTNLDGLIGIVRERGFWLSEHRCLNDLVELESGKKIAISVLKKFGTVDCDSTFRDILHSAAAKLSKHQFLPLYICSFSKDLDSLALWRGYAKNGKGVSIVFDYDPGNMFFTTLPHMRAVDVFYKNKDKERICNEIIKIFLDEYNKDIKNNDPPVLDDWLKDKWITDLAEGLLYVCVSFKHEAFSSEKEVRVIAYNEKDFNGLEYRTVKERIVPYINSARLYKGHDEYEKGDVQLPISKVIIGPTANQNEMNKSIEKFLKDHNYSEVRVCSSNIPFRE